MQNISKSLRRLSQVMMSSNNQAASASTQASPGSAGTSTKPKAKLNVHKFPRPPLCERTDRHLVIKWNDQVVADTKEAYWVLETTHAPSTFIFTYSRSSSILNISNLVLSYVLLAFTKAFSFHQLTHPVPTASLLSPPIRPKNLSRLHLHKSTLLNNVRMERRSDLSQPDQ
jgi:hypothetical protein